MKTNLIVNPLASIDVVEDTGDLICGGPVPGRGMRHLHVSPAEAHLYSIFSELSNIGLANLNVARDLNADEIILLTECGILTDDANVPERPLFACMLGDIEPIEPGNADIGSLTVNPTLEIQPFDLTNFRPMMQKNLSPYHATAWVSDPSTEMRWGYWLTPDETAFLDRIARGVEIGPDELDPPMLNRLTVAAILIDPNERPPREAPFRSAAEFFAINRYAVIDDLIPAPQVRALQRYYRTHVDQGFMKFGDGQVPLRFAEYCEPVAVMVQNSFTDMMSKVAGIAVKPTYSYSAVYTEGALLEPHVDREDCEFSFSLQLDYSPASTTGISPWPLYISSAADTSSIDFLTDTAIYLPNGSCVAYKGRELIHYRTPLPAGHRSTSLFFHYIPV